MPVISIFYNPAEQQVRFFVPVAVINTDELKQYLWEVFDARVFGASERIFDDGTTVPPPEITYSVPIETLLKKFNYSFDAFDTAIKSKKFEGSFNVYDTTIQSSLFHLWCSPLSELAICSAFLRHRETYADTVPEAALGANGPP